MIIIYIVNYTIDYGKMILQLINCTTNLPNTTVLPFLNHTYFIRKIYVMQSLF